MKTLKKGSYIVFQRPDTVETDTSQRTIPVRPQARAGRGSLRGAALHAVGLSGSAPFARPFFFFFPFFSLLRRYGTEKLPPGDTGPTPRSAPAVGAVAVLVAVWDASPTEKQNYGGQHVFIYIRVCQ